MKLLNRLNNMSKKQEIIFICIFYSTIVVGFFFVLKLFNCGYHLVDDEEFLYYVDLKKIEGLNWLDIANKMELHDIKIRFRPMYIYPRVLFSIIFGCESLLPYTIIKMLEGIILFILMHCCSRRLKNSFISSIFFVGFSVLGFHVCILWKLGTHELQGMLFFTIGFFLLLCYLDKRNVTYLIFSCIAFIIMCCYKENFILLMPFILSFIIYEWLSKYTSDINIHKIIQALREESLVIISYVCIMTLALSIVIFGVGTNKYDGVGIGLGTSIKSDLAIWGNALLNDLKWYSLFLPILIAILLTYWDNIRRYWKEFILLMFFIMPQVVIYHAMGFVERYAFPAMVGLSYFFVVFPFNKKILSGKRKFVYVVTLTLLFLAQSRITVREADYFRYRGNSVQTVLNTILDISKQNDDVKILSCLHPNEEGDSVLCWWNMYYGYNNVYVWMEDDKLIVPCKVDKDDFLATYDYQGDLSLAQNDMDVIVKYNQEDRHWCYFPSIDTTNYDYYKCGTLDLYINKELDVELPNINVQGLRVNI